MDKQLHSLAPCWALLLVVGCGTAKRPQPEIDTNTSVHVEETTLDAPDTKLHYRAASAGTPTGLVIAINGGPGVTHQYMTGLERLAQEGWRVVTYDQRGIGESSPSESDSYGPEAHVADVDALRAHFDADSVWLIGHSWGGYIAMRYALDHPERVLRLTLIGSVPPSHEALEAGLDRLYTRVEALQAAGKIVDPLPKDPTENMRARLPAYFSDPDFPLPKEVLAAKAGGASKEIWAQCLEDYDFTRELGSFKGHVDILMGADDPFELSWADALAHAFTEADVHRRDFPACGHLPWVECPSAFFRALNE